jgi:SOS-response transcriptional repressor LexA
MTSRGDELVTVRLAGAIVQGAPIDTRVAGALVAVPREKLDADDLVYRVAGTGLCGHGIERSDLLIVEPRSDGNAATGELVVVTLEHRTFVGRWWTKHGRRVLLDHALQTIAEGSGLCVMGAVTVVIREQ